MKKYHIVYRYIKTLNEQQLLSETPDERADRLSSKGENFNAESPGLALLAFYMKYSNAKFICMYDLDELSHLNLAK